MGGYVVWGACPREVDFHKTASKGSKLRRKGQKELEREKRNGRKKKRYLDKT